MWKFLPGVSKPESTFKTYSECRILHVIIKNVLGEACPQTSLANTGLDIFLQG
jgi:hypothetical protein